MEADGLRFVLQVYESGPFEVGQAITPILLQLLDKPATRQLISPKTGLGFIFAGFTNAFGQGNIYLQTLASTAANVLTVLRSWTGEWFSLLDSVPSNVLNLDTCLGLLFCCVEDRRNLKNLVEALRVPVIEMREVLLDMLVDLFRMKTPFWFQRFLENKAKTDGKAHSELVRGNGLKRLACDPQDSARRSSAGSGRHAKLNVTDQYLSLLLALFVDAGLLEVSRICPLMALGRFAYDIISQSLVDVIEEQAPSISRKATFLVAELLIMSARLLPLKYAPRVQVSISWHYQQAQHPDVVYVGRRFPACSNVLPSWISRSKG